eukprot:GHRQ01021603.1.p2 GENE.GHRQ01021603.1~~GHRQ01021603.1.p2  ORF type:complete len:107 (-),score=19.52 GHRQ01021603.1:401-721(-)
MCVISSCSYDTAKASTHIAAKSADSQHSKRCVPQRHRMPHSRIMYATGASREEELLDVSLPKLVPAARALPVPRLEVLGDALLAEHVPALGDNDVLLARVAHVALE